MTKKKKMKDKRRLKIKRRKQAQEQAEKNNSITPYQHIERMGRTKSGCGTSPGCQRM